MAIALLTCGSAEGRTLAAAGTHTGRVRFEAAGLRLYRDGGLRALDTAGSREGGGKMP